MHAQTSLGWWEMVRRPARAPTAVSRRPASHPSKTAPPRPRSVPTMSNVYPVLRYRDADAAIDFVQRAFGFEPKEVHRNDDGTVAHAELTCGDDLIMLSTERDTERWGSHAGQGWLYIAIDDPDAHHDRAKAAGAEIVMELSDQDYGSRDYSARDPEGNLWSFGTYRPA
jgi:uncharacterized glyoxalase superfamily protein PhnB